MTILNLDLVTITDVALALFFPELKAQLVDSHALYDSAIMTHFLYLPWLVT
jgi:hypothetical protein